MYTMRTLNAWRGSFVAVAVAVVHTEGTAGDEDVPRAEADTGAAEAVAAAGMGGAIPSERTGLPVLDPVALAPCAYVTQPSAMIQAVPSVSVCAQSAVENAP